MGIDIYMEWKGQTKEEKEKQFQGFDTTIGDTGYLREAYHGEPYATKVLVPESFDTGEAKIKASVLRKRLRKTIKAAIEREKVIYNRIATENDERIKSFVNFVKLAEIKEKETGEPVTIIASY